jgi:hypothetical protein
VKPVYDLHRREERVHINRLKKCYEPNELIPENGKTKLKPPNSTEENSNSSTNESSDDEE